MNKTISYSTGLIIEDQYLMFRSFYTDSITAEGYRPIINENYLGQRIVIKPQNIAMHQIPLNDSSTDTMYKLYEVLQISYSEQAITNIDKFISDSNLAVDYYSTVSMLKEIISNKLLSFSKRKDAVNSLISLQMPECDVAVPIPAGYTLHFAENDHLQISPWLNGNYYNIRLSLIAKKELIL